MSKVQSKMDRLREMREAKANRIAGPRLTSKEIDKIVRSVRILESNVTPPASIVTSRAKPAGSGRKKVFASGAQKQRAYRQRLKASNATVTIS